MRWKQRDTSQLSPEQEREQGQRGRVVVKFVDRGEHCWSVISGNNYLVFKTKTSQLGWELSQVLRNFAQVRCYMLLCGLSQCGLLWSNWSLKFANFGVLKHIPRNPLHSCIAYLSVLWVYIANKHMVYHIWIEAYRARRAHQRGGLIVWSSNCPSMDDPWATLLSLSHQGRGKMCRCQSGRWVKTSKTWDRLCWLCFQQFAFPPEYQWYIVVCAF
jgi:hypothetical protein